LPTGEWPARSTRELLQCLQCEFVCVCRSGPTFHSLYAPMASKASSVSLPRFPRHLSVLPIYGSLSVLEESQRGRLRTCGLSVGKRRQQYEESVVIDWIIRSFEVRVKTAETRADCTLLRYLTAGHVQETGPILAYSGHSAATRSQNQSPGSVESWCRHPAAWAAACLLVAR